MGIKKEILLLSMEKRRNKPVILLLFCFVITVLVTLMNPIVLKSPFQKSNKKAKAVIVISYDDMLSLHPKMKRARCLICKNKEGIRILREFLENNKGEGDIATCESRLYLPDYDDIVGLVLDRSVIGMQTKDNGWIEIEAESDVFKTICSFSPTFSPVVFY